MNKPETKLGFWTFTLLWFGAAVSIAEIMTGGMLAPLGFQTGVIVILIGHLLGTSIFLFCGIIGTREKLPAIASTKATFGKYGTYLFALLNVIQLIGWTAIMIRSAAASLNSISSSLWSFDQPMVWNVFIGLLVAVWIWYGRDGMKSLNNAAVVLLFGLTLVLGYLIFKDGTVFARSTHSAAADSISIGTAIELNVVMPLSWLPLIADYTRFAKTERGGAFGSFIGYFLGSSWMFIIGLGGAIVSGNSDPSVLMLGANLGILALGIVVLSTVTTTFLDAYSAGVSLLNIAPKLKERQTAILMTVLGTGMAIFLTMDHYINFLYLIGSVFAPLFAILIVDYFIIGKEAAVFEERRVNPIAMFALVIGIAAYYQFVGVDLVCGSTAPVMLLTGSLYCIARKGVVLWKSRQNSKMQSAA